MAAEEAIMICLDNCEWMKGFENRYSYNLQYDSVRSYCRAKLKSNPKNAIGIVGMGSDKNLIEPTSDVDKIIGQLKHYLNDDVSVLGGKLQFLEGLTTSRKILLNYPSNNCLKRIIFFLGGPTDVGIKCLEEFGKSLKEEGIAVDVVNFFSKNHNGGYWTSVIEAFVAAANKDDNSHIKHVRPHAWTLSRDVLLSRPKLISDASLEEEEIRRLETKTAPVTYHNHVLETNKEIRNILLARQREDYELNSSTSKTVGVEQSGEHKEFEKEVIMICIDNSEWMRWVENRYSYNLQINCVRSYCRAKLKCNPKNAIGIVGMGANKILVEPTSDVDKILGIIKYYNQGPSGVDLFGGNLNFGIGYHMSKSILRNYPRNCLKRVFFFLGGPINIPVGMSNMKYSEKLGMHIKKEGIAVDVVNLLSPMKEECYCYKERIEAFVAGANKDGNSHIKHVRPHAWTLSRHVLLSRKPKFISDASLEEDEIRRLKTKKQKQYKRAQLIELDSTCDEAPENETVGVKQPSNVEYVEAFKETDGVKQPRYVEFVEAFKASDNNENAKAKPKPKMESCIMFLHPFWLLFGCFLISQCVFYSVYK